jgi:hypothetical protein
MDAKLQVFILRWTGIAADFDGKYGAQCFDLIQFWSQAIGGPFITGATAKDIANFQNPFYTWVPNSPSNAPAPGDIFVYGEPWGKYVDANGNTQYCGHTGVVVTADANTVTIFEQNDKTATDPNGLPAVMTHAYLPGALGWLHPNTAPATTTEAIVNSNLYKGFDLTNTDSMKVAIDAVVKLQAGELIDKAQFDSQSQAATSCQTQLKTANDTIENLQQKINDITNKFNDLKSKYDSEAAKNIDLNEANKKISGENQDNAEKALEAEHLADNRKDFVQAIMDALDVKYDVTDERDIVEKCLERVSSLKQTQADSPLAQTVKEIISHLNDQFGMNEYFKANNLPTIDSLDDPQLAAKVKQYLTLIMQEIQKNPAAAAEVIKKNPSFLVKIVQNLLSKLYQ